MYGKREIVGGNFIIILNLFVTWNWEWEWEEEDSNHNVFHFQIRVNFGWVFSLADNRFVLEKISLQSNLNILMTILM